MKTIRYSHTLFYYDGPQVFEARDAIGGHYIGVMIEPDGGKARFLVAGVEPERLRKFRMGTIDLRSLILERGEAEWFLATPGSDLDTPLTLQAQAAPLATFEHLPDAGFVLHGGEAITETLRESRARNNLVMEVAIAPPEAVAEHRIRMMTLAGLLTHLQMMVKHAYGMALRELPLKSRQAIDRSDAHLLDVVIPAAPGSFRVVLEAAKLPAVLGQSEMSRALERIDELFADVAEPQKTLAKVKAHRGHLAGAYLRMLRFLVQNRSGLRYSWAEPNFNECRSRSVTEAQAGPLADLLSGVSNLGAENVTVFGALVRADIESGAWRLATPEGDVSGRTKDGGPSLVGLKLGSTYCFACLEEIEETQGGREQRTLYLTEHEPV